MIKTSEARWRQLESVESIIKQNKDLHGDVKAREDEIISLKEERTRPSQRIYQVQQDKRNLLIEHDIAREELATAQAELAKTGTQLAIMVEERNGRKNGFLQVIRWSAYLLMC